MYNFFVSASAQSWLGDPWEIDLSRCVREYTDTEITRRLGGLDAVAVDELKRLPCIFAYEEFNALAPKFGVIKDVIKRQTRVRVEYELIEVFPFLSSQQLAKLSFELDIQSWELNRSHWAVKNVDLPKELNAVGISLPGWTRSVSKAVDISTHYFDVALSFPGEARQLVERIVPGLERRLGPNSYFYDNNYISQLARPSLDIFLQKIYRDQSRLVVVFIGSDYQRKSWCGIEFRAIKEIIASRDHQRVMLVRVDDGSVDGIFSTDGYVDARQHAPEDIARFIHERVQLLG
ncbi:MAG: TIR domain-containing protein [Xanthomonadaceae bacterium]|nr:TIR domain-containing protein [Xanthomonadaceae bacterium]